MASSSRRAVISGIGALCALGKDTKSVWEGFQQGRSGVRLIRSFDTSGLPVRIGAEMPDFDPKAYIPREDKDTRKQLRIMARSIQLAVAAARLAVADGAVDLDRLDRERFGCEFGSGLIAMELPEIGDASVLSAGPQETADLVKWGTDGLPTIQPLWMLKYLPNMQACHVSIMFDARGPNNTITESDVASLLALGEAYRNLQRDAADFFLVGGAESKINPLSMVRQCLFEPISRRNDQPEKACRPFDRSRDGLVLGEGGAVLVVEDLEHARQRGARVYAEVVGFGAAFDHGRTGKGIARAARAAMAEAGITPEQVDHVSAHGLGSVASDAWEARGLREAFGDVPVLALKGAIGNLGAGGPVTELAVSVLALHHGRRPGTLNHEEPDPACPVNVATAPAAVSKPYVVKVGFTQMGQCGAVVVRRWEDEG